MGKSLCTLLSLLALNSASALDDKSANSVFGYIGQHVMAEPENKYRMELFKEEHPVARVEYVGFLHGQLSSYDVIAIDGKTQTMYHITKTSDGLDTKSYDISTAKTGFSNVNKSNKTSIGLHFIHSKNAKIGKIGKEGDGAKVGTVFDYEYKKQTPWVPITPGQNTRNQAFMTTRRINFHWWRGQAIHGTNHLKYIGQPRSHGCIRMRNDDVIELFNNVNENTPVYTSPDLQAEIKYTPIIRAEPLDVEKTPVEVEKTAVTPLQKPRTEPPAKKRTETFKQKDEVPAPPPQPRNARSPVKEESQTSDVGKRLFRNLFKKKE